MNIKNLFAILMLGSTLEVLAQAPSDVEKQKQIIDYQLALRNGAATTIQKCSRIIELSQKVGPSHLPKDNDSVFKLQECLVLQQLSQNQPIDSVGKENNKNSIDGRIICRERTSFTQDFDECEKAIRYYNAVFVAEKAMSLEQTIRTDLKNQSIQKKAQSEIANGASQTSIFDAAAASNNHQKAIQQEKMVAYSAAVAALVAAHQSIPTIDKITEQVCSEVAPDLKQNCPQIIARNKGGIAANGEAKSALLMAIMEFTAKGAAAGIAMGQYGNAAKQIQAAKSTITDQRQDLMMDPCVLNPTDPACAKTRERISGQSISSGEFGTSDMGGTNTFTLGGESEVTPVMGNETRINDNAPVAGINSPFVDDAKVAKGILEPAAAANMQPTGGAGNGSGGGSGGGGLGGGGASLGSDINGSNKDGDKEAQIKTNKISATYSQGSGGGYRSSGKSKDDTNRFASLFDSKGSIGGVEEDRSIASGDIDGSASGLFQKISKRYNKIQADKRIEAKNLE
jgi:hypothetical protein